MAQKMSDERRVEMKKILDHELALIQSESKADLERALEPRELRAEMSDRARSSQDDDVEFQLMEMRSERKQKLEEACRRLEDGTYGYCFPCGGEIAERRLRALPFAVRCRDCEEARDVAETQVRARFQRHSSSSLFLDMSS